jgi:hypothetical protein
MSLISFSKSVSFVFKAYFFFLLSNWFSVALYSLLTWVSSCMIDFCLSLTVSKTCKYLSLVFSMSTKSSSAYCKSLSWSSSLASSRIDLSLCAADLNYKRFSSWPIALGWYSSCISCIMEKRSSSSRHSSIKRDRVSLSISFLGYTRSLYWKPLESEGFGFYGPEESLFAEAAYERSSVSVSLFKFASMSLI